MPNLFQRFASVFRRAPATEPEAPPASAPPDPNRTTPLPDLASVINVETIKSPVATLAPKTLLVGSAQHVGRVRAHNEDVLLAFTGELAGLDAMPHFGLFVVADGMGGHALGERASGIAARTVAREALAQILPFLLAYPETDTERPSLLEIMERAMATANQAVFAGVPEGGGTTLTCALLIGEQMVLAHVGDSRAYLSLPDSLEQLSRDHSLVQRLQELGQLSAAEAAVHPQRNVLYRAVGQGDGLEVDVEAHRLPPGGTLLLCSDGLWGLVPNDRIQTLMREAPNLQAACEALVAAANAAGGPDNITALMVQLPQ